MTWRRFFHRRHDDLDHAEEFRAHLAIEIEENIGRGISPEDARHAAYAKFGNPTAIREEVYTMNGIGYWLKPEFSKEEHEAGSVGACHGEEPDTAACRFYITLSKAPFLDGNFTIFGKVVQGLDVVRTIYSQGVIVEDKEHNGFRKFDDGQMIHGSLNSGHFPVVRILLFDALERCGQNEHQQHC